MEKRDLKKTLKQLYQSSAKEIVRVDVPVMNFLKVDGTGDPNTSPAYAEAIEVHQATHAMQRRLAIAARQTTENRLLLFQKFGKEPIL